MSSGKLYEAVGELRGQVGTFYGTVINKGQTPSPEEEGEDSISDSVDGALF